MSEPQNETPSAPLGDPQRDPYSWLRRILPFTTIAVIIAVLYAGWVFYSRWNQDRETANASAAKQAEDAKHTVDLLGGGEFKILNFYAVPGAVKKGGSSTVCYGVSEAKTVKIDPPIEELHPAISHCMQVTPKKTTTYTLTATDSKGHTATQSFDLQVVP